MRGMTESASSPDITKPLEVSPATNEAAEPVTGAGPRWRMSGWLATSVALALLIALIAPQQLPVSIYKLSLVTAAAVAGYWIDRSLFPYARPDPDAAAAEPLRYAASMMRRAIIVAAAMMAMGLGA